MTDDLGALAREAESDGPGRVRAAGRLMSLVEDEPDRVFELAAELAEAPEPRIVLGITGAPGSGKSLLVDRLIASLRVRNPECGVGVIAVDPSSPYSKGALLGDRVRMMRHATDAKVFIRSVATRGHLGGLTLGALGILRVMGLLGCDVVLIETVGVGQSEIEIKTVADLVAVVLAPGQGDAIQFLKAGLMEAGDLFVVNKSDLPDAARFHAQLLVTLRLLDREQRRITKDAVRRVSARENHGIPELLDFVEQRFVVDRERWVRHRQQALALQVRQAILEQARIWVRQALEDSRESDPIGRVLRGETTISDLVTTVFRRAADAHPLREGSDDHIE